MADISVLIAQELLRLAEQLTLPTRIYFPSGTFAADVTTIAFDAAWNSTGAAVRRKAVTDGKKLGTAAATNSVTSAATNPEKALIAQYVSKPLRAQSLSGNVRGQFRALESNASFNGTLQIGIRVVSVDGATVRATLLAVGGTVTTATTPPEFATSLTNRRLLTSGDVTPLPLASYTCADGDRLVIEIGVADKDAGTARTAGISFGDNTVDLTTDDTATAAQDPWIEFDTTIQFQDQVEKLRLADSGTTQLMNQGWVRIGDSVSAQLSAGSDLNKNLGDAEIVHVADTVSAIRDLTASPSEALAIAETLSAGSILQATAGPEAMRLVDTATPTLDPIQAAPAESVRVIDATPTILPIWLVTVAPESLRLIDSGGGTTALLGVLHLADGPVTAALTTGGLTVVAPTESIRLSETLTASRDLTASVSELLLLADVVTADADRWALVSSEAVRVADTPTPTLNPEQASPTEALRIAETATATITSDLAGTPASEEGATHLQDGAPVVVLNPLASTPSEDVRIGDPVVPTLNPEQAIAPSEAVQIADGPALGAIGAPTLLAPVGNEALRLADSTTRLLNPLEAAPSETLRLADGPVSTLISGNLSRQVADETLRLIDAGRGASALLGVLHVVDGPVLASLEGAELVAAASETIRVAETATPTLNPLDTGLLTEAVVGLDTPQSGFSQLSAVLTPETVILSDRVIILKAIVTESLALSDSGRGATQLIGTLRITDTVQAQLGQILSAGPGETVRIGETLVAERSPFEATATETVKIGYSQSEVEYTQDEYLRVAEVLATALTAPADLSVLAQTEALVLADTVIARRDLETAIPVESLRLTADAPTGARDLIVSVTDALRVADTATVSRDLTAAAAESSVLVDTATAARDLDASLAEAVRLADDSLQVSRELAVAVTEIVRVTDVAAGRPDADVITTETLRLADAVSVALNLSVALVEGVRLADAQTSVLNPLATIHVESAVVQEVLFVSLAEPTSLSTGLGETLVLADANASSQVDPEATSVIESLRLADQVTAVRQLGISVDAESIRLADDVVTARDLTAAPSEHASIAEDLAAQSTIEATLTDGLRLGEELTAVVDRAVALAETLVLGEALDAGDGTTLHALCDEEMRLASSVAPAMELRAGLEQEDVQISDTIEATLAIVVVVAPETVRSYDNDFLQLGLDLSVELPGPDVEPIEFLAFTEETLSTGMFVGDALTAPGSFTSETLRPV